MSELPRVVGLHHVQLAMPAGGEGQARAFYGSLLGLVEIPKPMHLAGRGGCWFRTEQGLELHLGIEEDFRPARKAHPALLVEGLGELEERFLEIGVEVARDTELEGHRRLYASDPFGNRLEFIERLPSA